jgi:hypothetical protein
MKYRLPLTSIALVALAYTSAYSQPGPPTADVNVVNTPLSVTVENPEGTPVNVQSTVKKIPFYCNELILSPENIEDPNCFRADTRTLVTPVPEGFNLVLTDVVTNRNALSPTGGSFFLEIGRADSGAFPVPPNFDFSGDPAQSPTIHFTSPYVVLGPGESLRAQNGIRVSTPNASIVDVFLSGYIVRTEDLGR